MKPKIALLSGNGTLPRVIVEALSEQVRDFEIICFDDENTKYVGDCGLKVHAMQLENVAGIIKKLREIKAKEVVFCGGVRFRGIRQMKLFTLDNLKLLLAVVKNLVKIGLSRQQGDDLLLSAAQGLLHDIGIKIVGAHEIVPNILCSRNDEINPSLAKSYKNDINLGRDILNTISKFDIGQSIIIQNGRVIGMEGAEGTDELIRRCGGYKLKCKTKPVLVKMCKVGQSMKTDLPTIGVNTFKRVVECGLAGVAISCGSAIVLDREEIKKICEKEGVFLVTIVDA